MAIKRKGLPYCFVLFVVLVFTFMILKLKNAKISKITRVHSEDNSGPDEDLSEEEGIQRLPQCIIVGVRKAGTRALITFLNLHPDIVAPYKEPHFFSSDTNYVKGLDYYRNLMPQSKLSQITIEKTPAYFFSPNDTLIRIRAMNESIKIIVIVREPVERAISEYIMFDYYLNGSKEPFEKLAFKEDGSVAETYFRIENSRYYTHTNRWLQFFSRDQIHFVNGDALIKDPQPELHKIEAFLSLRHKITRENFYFSQTKGFYCYKEKQKAEKCLSKSKGRTHPEISPEHRRILNEYFRPFNKKFFELIGQDFGWPS